jgi:hypothetical protein
MSRRPTLVLLTLASIVGTTAVVGLALAQSAAPDHDYDLAQSKFGQNQICPQGRVLGKSEWETLAQREAQIDPPPGVDLGTPEPLDYVMVVPDDPAPYLKGVSEVPDGMLAVVPCVAVSPERLVLADDAANLYGTASS